MSNSLPRIFLIITLLIFMGVLIYTFVVVGKVTANADNSVVFDDTIKTIAGMNGTLMALMTLIAFQYVRSDINAGPPYIFLMLHFNLFLSLLAVSISVLSKKQ